MFEGNIERTPPRSNLQNKPCYNSTSGDNGLTTPEFQELALNERQYSMVSGAVDKKVDITTINGFYHKTDAADLSGGLASLYLESPKRPKLRKRISKRVSKFAENHRKRKQAFLVR